ncbi:MAG: glucosaminidase domain-containing protein [Bacteroidales bacterium]|nr:glucosaminidase domain-containing protein [Bacteroidales bacterium]MCF8350883.1 glucosaminidase domain-containing protein [Bacteroidales bacterium]MCF8375635.1 glucosaminidase domain-containing protein [Bacteroidales bacterium]MCF8400782.1 glucosaminidase domain-containing protein [Bacteroidales bacterium]
MKHLFTAICFLLLSGFVTGQKMTREEYIERYKDIAIEKMKEYRIPASITLAQGILESGDGNSKLARKANNHFGIKCHKGWRGKTFRQDDDLRNECFRKYDQVEDSYRDHSYFLTQRDRYAGLFKLNITDYKAWARGLKKAGYATSPIYPQLLIKIIEENKLYNFDQETIALLEKKEYDPPEASDVYYIVDETEFRPVSVGGDNREIYLNNKRKFIIAKEGDDFWSLADEFNIYAWQVYKYNDLDKTDQLKPGQMVYLQKKKRKSKEYEYHLVEKGETMYSISQRYGIKLKRLYKMNDLDENFTRPKAGTRLKLR